MQVKYRRHAPGAGAGAGNKPTGILRGSQTRCKYRNIKRKRRGIGAVMDGAAADGVVDRGTGNEDSEACGLS